MCLLWTSTQLTQGLQLEVLEHQTKLDKIVKCGKEQENLASATPSSLGYPSLQERYKTLKVIGFRLLTVACVFHLDPCLA